MLLFAHGIVGRADLPIPETLFGAAAAAVLVVSFFALALGWSRPRLKALGERDLFVFPLALEVLLGVLTVAVFLFTVYAGLAGTSGQFAQFNGALQDGLVFRRQPGRQMGVVELAAIVVQGREIMKHQALLGVG